MKIAILQFNPRLGDEAYNIQQAQQILDSDDTPIDLLVLPELAFSGYNFPSLEAIKPYLSSTLQSPATAWARQTAKQRQCHVIVGYPEVAKDDGSGAGDLNFNSTVMIGPNGDIVGDYRKSFLYYTDELWAREGFHPTRHTPPKAPFFIGEVGSLGPMGHGICMDINPYRFEAPWTEYEFAGAMLHSKVKLVVLSMAWITQLTVDEVHLAPDRPDMGTVAYWLERFRPFTDLNLQEPIVVVFANRCGSEGNVVGGVQTEDGHALETGNRVAYAGSSCVTHFQDGKVKLWARHAGPKKSEAALMGRGEEGLLVVDTAQDASFMLLEGG